MAIYIYIYEHAGGIKFSASSIVIVGMGQLAILYLINNL